MTRTLVRYKATCPTVGKVDPKTGEPVQQFNGTTCGVRFQDGIAYFDDVSMRLRKDNKRSALQAAVEMVNDFGYTITQIDEAGHEQPFDPHAKAAGRQHDRR